MKKIIFSLIAVFTFALTHAQVKDINISKSHIKWTGKKITGKHFGSISFKSGNLKFDNKNLMGGSFVVDMNTITVEDIEGTYKKKLEGHLNSADFFDVANHSDAVLTFKNVKKKAEMSYEVAADLTIKGITKPITFMLNLTKHNAETKLMVDRTAYNIKYGSASFFDKLGDRAIKDEFELEVSLVF